MLKVGVAGLAFLFVTVSSPAHAQAPPAAGPPQELLSAPELKDLTDIRIEVLKAALQLKPDQERYWPAIEEAIRARATARRARWENLAARRMQEREFDALALVRGRADALAQRAAELNKLADAWQPLHQTLDPNQKRRLRFLSVFVVREMRDPVLSRRMQYEEYEDWDPADR